MELKLTRISKLLALAKGRDCVHGGDMASSFVGVSP